MNKCPRHGDGICRCTNHDLYSAMTDEQRRSIPARIAEEMELAAVLRSEIEGRMEMDRQDMLKEMEAKDDGGEADCLAEKIYQGRANHSRWAGLAYIGRDNDDGA